MENLVEYRGSSRLKRAALNILVKMLPHSEIKKLREQFELIDTDSSGIIDANELANAMKQNPKIQISDEEID